MNVGDLFKDLVWDAMVKAGLKELFTIAPWLGWGPMGYVVTFIVTHFSDQLYRAVSTTVSLQQIAYQNDEAKAAFDRASVTLKIIAQDKGPESPEYLEAKNAAKQALAVFVRIAPAA